MKVFYLRIRIIQPEASSSEPGDIVMVKAIIRKLLLGHKADSPSYITHLRRLGMRIGERVTVFDPRRVFIDETRPWMVEIGDDVQITRGVTILTHGYDWSVLKGVSGEVLGSCGKVTIGNNVFVGMNAIILKGVTIGGNVIIGAGSVVTGDIPDSCVAAGNPARVLMSLEEYHEKRKAAQEQEARELVTEYRAVYGKDPDEQALSEFFWLFTDNPQALPPCWDEKMALAGDLTRSKQALRQNQKRYENMEAFLDACRKGGSMG